MILFSTSSRSLKWHSNEEFDGIWIYFQNLLGTFQNLGCLINLSLPSRTVLKLKNILYFINTVNICVCFLYSVQFSCSVVCTLYDPMDCSTPSLPVHHQLPEFLYYIYIINIYNIYLPNLMLVNEQLSFCRIKIRWTLAITLRLKLYKRVRFQRTGLWEQFNVFIVSYSRRF